MKLIVGLGNPGERYAVTRHNVGFVVAEALALKLESPSWRAVDRLGAEITQVGETCLVKPQTFMNKSGEAVAKIARFYKVLPESIYVVHDDLDIVLGDYKVQLGRGPQLHYGVESVERELGNKMFWRVRVGVENREVKGNGGVPGEQYSLQNFAKDEAEVVSQVTARVVAQLVGVIS